MFEVQRTRNAHVNAPDSAFYTVSKHRKLECAYDALRKLENAQAKRCAMGAWDCNFRILDNGESINLVEYEMLRYEEEM